MESTMGFGYYKTGLMENLQFTQNHIFHLASDLLVTLEIRMIRQIGSEAHHSDELNWRSEFPQDWSMNGTVQP